MKALILLAGCGSRLCDYTKTTPKSLLKVKGKPMLYHIVSRIRANGIKDLVIVVGFQKEKIIDFLKSNFPDLNFEFVENEVYEKTNTLYSMWCARDLLREGFVYFHGDIIFNKAILANLLNPKFKNGAIVEVHKESMEVFGFDGIITKISKKKDAIGKALGIYKFSPDIVERLFEEAGKVIKAGSVNAYQSAAINEVIVHHRLDLVSTGNMSWIEVDEEDDLLEAERILAKIEKEEAQQGAQKKLVKEDFLKETDD